nr:squalene synthase [Tanacetum cinerariifolium]
MADVYQAFYDFSDMLKFKVDMHDPNGQTTSTRLEAAQNIYKDSRTLSNRKSYIFKRESCYSLVLLALLFIILAILYAYLSLNRPNKIKFTL